MVNDYRSWLDRAKSSLTISKNKFDKNIFYEDLCFQAEQAVEKALKSFLLFYNIEPKKTHNLVLLIKDLSKHIDISKEVNETVILNNYAVETRYPGNYTPIGKEEYDAAIKIAEDCIIWIEEKIAELENQLPP